jgi:hypothetical protein
MKTKIIRISLLFVAFALFNIAIVPKAALAQGNAFHWRFAGKGASATWDNCQNEYSCSYKSIYVSETMYRADGSKFKGTTLSYYESSYDSMTNTYTYSYGYMENPTYAIDKKLNSASVSGNVPMWTCTYDGNTGEENCVESSTVAVSASWTGNGELIKGSYKGHTVSKSFTSNYSYKGSWRSASATGSVNGVNLGASSWADLFNFKDANVYVCHGGC